MSDSKKCARCGNEFFRDRANDTSIGAFNARKYCSISCTNASKAKKFPRTCVICKGEFKCRPCDTQRVCGKRCAKSFFDSFFSDMSMTQAEVAARLNMTPGQVQYIENKAMMKLANAAANSPILREMFER